MARFNDKELVAALYGLGLDEDNLSAIVLLPLVEVAWADGRIGEPERRLILDIARKRGVLDGEGALLLETWLRYRPSDRYMARGREVLAELGARGHDGAGITPHTLSEVVSFCEEVARAAGGLLGRAFKTIGAVERAALTEIAEALSSAGKPSWEGMATDLKLAEQGLLDDDDDVTAFDEGDPITAAAARSAARKALNITPAVSRRVRSKTSRAAPPATLTRVSAGHGAGVFRVTERGLSIGRRTDNDIVILDDPQVSRQHARIFHQGVRLYIVDCASAGGTYVNGERVHERRLLGDEEIRVGMTLFAFNLGLVRD